MTIERLQCNLIFMTVACVSCSPMVGVVAAAQPPAYQVINLGRVTITGGGAKDINETGQIALNLNGTAYVYDHGVLFPGGGVQNNNTTFAINDLAHMTWTLNLNAAYWNGTSVSILPNTFAGWNLNDLDHVVGSSQQPRAFFWDGTNVNLLPRYEGVGAYNGNPEIAMAINNSDVIVGMSASNPVKWVNGTVQQLPIPSGYTRGAASDINETGEIVGSVSDNLYNTNRAMLWDGAGVTDLGSITGHNLTWAYGINEIGQIVGEANTSSEGDPRAFFYDKGAMHDLTDLAGRSDWVLEKAYAINTAGEIVGVGRFNGTESAFLLSPNVPEPASAILFSIAAIACFACHGHRTRE